MSENLILKLTVNNNVSGAMQVQSSIIQEGSWTKQPSGGFDNGSHMTCSATGKEMLLAYIFINATDPPPEGGFVNIAFQLQAGSPPTVIVSDPQGITHLPNTITPVTGGYDVTVNLEPASPDDQQENTSVISVCGPMSEPFQRTTAHGTTLVWNIHIHNHFHGPTPVKTDA